MRANEARLEQTERTRRGSLEEQQAPLHGRSKYRSVALDRDIPEQHDSRAYRRRVQRERRSTPRDVMQQQHQEWAVGPPPLAARWTRPSWQSRGDHESATSVADEAAAHRVLLPRNSRQRQQEWRRHRFCANQREMAQPEGWRRQRGWSGHRGGAASGPMSRERAQRERRA